MSVSLSIVAGAAAQFFDDNGSPLVGGKLYTYAAGTTTPAATYTSSTGLTANTNPIIMDAAGRTPAEIWLTNSASYKFVLKTSDDVLIGTYDNIASSQDLVDVYADFANTSDVSKGDALVGFRQSYYDVGAEINVNAPDAVGRTVNDKLQEFLSVKDFGAACDGVTDDSAAVQKAIDFCATFDPYWPTLVIPGRCKLASSVYIDRPVDGTKTEFRIVGQGAGAGFYGAGTITFFDSTLSMPAGSGSAPVSEFVTFENINFEASSFFDECFIISRKFLRIKFLNCFFWLTRCQVSDSYCQTLYFVACNIRNNKTNFINTAGLYDVTFDSCIIENGSTIIRSIDPNYGTSGLRFINNVIEGIGLSSVVVATGVSGFDLIGNHLESNYSPEFNFFGGAIVNGSVSVIGNYIYNPAGATFYYGPTTKVFSAGNTAFPSLLHSNAIQITDLISCADNCKDINGNAVAPSDAVTNSTVNGVYRAGTTTAAWTDAQNQITKDVNGNFGIGLPAQSNNRFLVKGADQTSTKYAGNYLDSAGNTIIGFRNDRYIEIPALQNFANDVAAAAGGIPVGFLYRNGSVVQVRVS